VLRRFARSARRQAAAEEGSLTLFTAIVAVGLFLAIALMQDAAVKMQAGATARGVAQEAARAGAEDINQSEALGRGVFVIDPAGAAEAARAFLSLSGHTGTVTVSGDRTIQVTVTVTEPAALTRVIGIPALSATGTATAALVHGITGPQP
jgi:hypothetical protein